MRALIVDDSSFIREYLRRLLEPMGILCEEAEHGGRALEVLAAPRGAGLAFDFMLLDVNMPVMSGLECVRALRMRADGAALKVMMVTTESDTDFIGQALAYGADEFLMKPFTPESLREKLHLLGVAA